MRDEPEIFLKSGVSEVSKLEIPPSPPNSTIDPAALGSTSLAYILNGSVYGQVFKEGRAYRLWGEPFVSTSTLSAATLASIASSTQCDRLVVLTRTGSGFEFYNVDISAATGAQSSVFGSAFGAFSQSDGTWMGYQHLDRAFFVGGVNGDVRQVQSLCGTAAASIVYKTAQFPANQFSIAMMASSIDSGYTTLDFAESGSAAFTYATMVVGSTSLAFAPAGANGNVAQYSNIEIFAMGDNDDDVGLQDPANGHVPLKDIIVYMGSEVSPCSQDFAYTWSASQDFTDFDYLWFKFDCTNSQNHAFTGTTIVASNTAISFAVTGATTTWISVPIQLSVTGSGSKVLNVWADLTGLSAAQRAAIARVRIKYNINKTGGGATYQGYTRISCYQGGKAYKLQTQATDTLSASPTQESIRYHLRYRSADGLTLSRTISNSVSPSLHEGYRPDSTLPKIGNIVTVSALVAGAPWDSTSKVDIYREVTDQVSGELRYFKIVDGSANTGTVTFTDPYSDRELLDSSTIPYVGSLDPSGVSLASGTIQVENMVCGTSWKGANVLFDEAGVAYISRVGTYTEFLWPGIEVAVDAEDVSRARFLQITPDGLPIIAAHGGDALYMFSRNKPYAITGEYPATSSRPSPLPNLGGILGPRALHPYQRGVVYGAKDGLHYVFVPFGFNGTAEQVEHVEMTKDNRECWEYLIGDTDGSAVSVSVDRNGRDLWAFNGARAIHIDTEAGVARRTWASGDTVLWSGFNHSRGLLTIMGTRALGVIGDYITDGGTNLTGSNGTSFDAQFVTKKFTDLAKVLRAQLWCRTPSADTEISLECLSSRGGTRTLTFNGENPVYNQAWPTSAATIGGRWFQFTLTLNAGTVVESMIVHAVSHDSKRGY